MNEKKVFCRRKEIKFCGSMSACHWNITFQFSTVFVGAYPSSLLFSSGLLSKKKLPNNATDNIITPVYTLYSVKISREVILFCQSDF
jgi:hypothetical protein